MNKIIIENRSAVSDVESLKLVSRVIENGRISGDNKQYCYLTTFDCGFQSKIQVATDLNKKSDRFILTGGY